MSPLSSQFTDRVLPLSWTNRLRFTDTLPTAAASAYRRLFQIERSFRVPKSDLAARPDLSPQQNSTQAHLSIVFAAMAVVHGVEQIAGWSIKRFVKTARRYRTVTIAAGDQVCTAAPRPTTSSTRPAKEPSEVGYALTCPTQ